MLKAALIKLLQQIEMAQKKANKVQKELAHYQVEGAAGGGMVKVVANANKEILEIKFDPDTFDSVDREMLEELTLAAINQALEKAGIKAQEELHKASENVFENISEILRIPGLMN